MDKKTKQTIGIIGATVGVSVIGIFGYWYYKKAKEQAKMDEMIEEGETDIAENYQNDRPILSKIKDAVVNKLYPQDYRNLPRTQRDIEKDMEEYEKQSRRRSRFTVYDNSVSKRFKIMETHTQEKRQTTEGRRLRTSGDRGHYSNRFDVYGKSGYNVNKRNPVLSDLDIPMNLPTRRKYNIY